MAQIFSLKNSKFFSGLKKICAIVPPITTFEAAFKRRALVSCERWQAFFEKLILVFSIKIVWLGLFNIRLSGKKST